MKKKIFYTSILLIMALLSAKSASAWRAKQELKPIDKLEASVGQDGSVTLSWSAPESNTKTNLILEEGFEEGIPFGWDTIDADKDGYHWEIMEVPTGHNSHNCISSASYIPNEGALTPDNYLITPALNLEKEATLSFWISSHNAAYPEEKWAVYASSEGASAEDFKEALLEGTLTAKSIEPASKNTSRQGEWYRKEVSLPAGTKYVAFRHFDCTDLFAIGLDDIKIETAADEPQVSGYTIYRGEDEIASQLTETTFTEQNVPAGEYKYCVVANYGVAGSSEAVCTSVSIEEIVEPSYDPITELKASYDTANKKVSLSWKRPSTRKSEILYEGFENEIPAEWTSIDADGDYYEWKHTTLDGYESLGCATSVSYTYSAGALSPDNYLITPQLDINKDAVLTYWVSAHSNSELPAEKYGVFISETTDDVAAFTELHSETMQEAGGKASQSNKAMREINTREVGGWSIRKIDISSYAGKEVYIAFRHYDSEDIFGLILDEVKVAGASVDPEPEEVSYNVYCNDAIIGNVETLKFTHNNSIPGSYKYEVEVKYGSGALSPKEAVEVQIPADEMDAAPVSNLKGSYDPETKTLKLDWDAPVIKTKVLYEKFEGGIPSNWLNVDADGDGHSWVSVSPEFSGVNPETGQTDLGTDCPTSASYINGTGPLTPDNWLITPKVKIPNNGKLSYWVRGYDPNAFQEHYGVFLSETDTEISSFTKELFSESLIRPDAQRNTAIGQRGTGASDRGHWNFREINLAEYAGKEVYLAFRHYEITDKYWLLLDEVTLSGNADVADLSWTYSVYHNDSETTLAQNLTAETYTHSNPPEGLQSYQVEVNYSNGMVSPKVAVEVNIVNPEPEGMAVIYLKAHDVWGDGTGYQILLDNTATQFGNAIPEVGALVIGCDVPADLSGKFSHRLPTNADISCTPEHQVVDGEEMTTIPAGIYDYCIVNPEPGINIWIASGELARQDNYEFKAGNEYHFEALSTGSSDMIVLTIVESTAEIESAAKAYGIEGYIVVDASQTIELSVFDLQGRRTVCKSISSKTMIPSEAGIYLVKLSSGSKSQSYKVIVK